MTASVVHPPSKPRVHAMAETPSRRILHEVMAPERAARILNQAVQAEGLEAEFESLSLSLNALPEDVAEATQRFDALKARLVKVANPHIQGYANQLLGSVRQTLGSTLKPSVMREQIQGADLYWRLFCANLDDLPAGLVDPKDFRNALNMQFSLIHKLAFDAPATSWLQRLVDGLSARNEARSIPKTPEAA